MERVGRKLQELNPATRHFLKLKELAQKSGIPRENFRQVEDLSDVIKRNPFSTDASSCTVLSDFDGVWTAHLSTDADTLSLQADEHLSSFVKKTENLTIWSSRLPVSEYLELPNSQIGAFIEKFISKNLNKPPLVSNSYLRELYNLIKQINPDCDIKFRLNPIKLILGGNDKGAESLIRISRQTLEQGHPLVILGSSFFDRRFTEHLIRRLDKERRVRLFLKSAGFNGPKSFDLKRLFYFDTNHLIY